MKRPSPSLAISVAALLVATGGTSYAAAMITSNDVVDDTLRSRDVKNGTLRAKDFRQFPSGEQGPQGEPGPAGPQGPPGAGRWVLINAAGEIEAQSGGFEVEAAYPTLPNTAPAGSPDNSLRANGNVYIEANEPLDDNGIVATIALQNQSDQNGDGITSGRAAGPDANPEFSGEITASMCAIPGVVACAPTGTNTNEYFVVSPRLSDGSVTTSANRKRFYVIITGDSTDYVAPTTP